MRMTYRRLMVVALALPILALALGACKNSAAPDTTQQGTHNERDILGAGAGGGGY